MRNGFCEKPEGNSMGKGIMKYRKGVCYYLQLKKKRCFLALQKFLVCEFQKIVIKYTQIGQKEKDIKKEKEKICSF